MSEQTPRAGRTGGPRRRRILFRLLLVAVPVLVVAGLGEALARAACPQRPNDWPSEWVEGLGFVTRRGATIRWAGSSYTPREFDVESRANSHGFLDVEPPPAPPPPGAPPRIVILGDSVVEGAQVPLEERMGRVLERELGGDAVDVVALGRSSTGPSQQWLFLERIGLPLRPALVVSVVVQNDLRNDSPELDCEANRWDPAAAPAFFFDLDAGGALVERPGTPPDAARGRHGAFRVPGLGFGAGAVEWLNGHSRLFTLLSRGFASWRWWNENYAGHTRGQPSVREGLPTDFHFFREDAPLGPDFEKAIRLSDAVIGRTAERVRASGARYAVMYAPLPTDLREEPFTVAGFRLDPKAQRARWRAICERRGVPFVDLAEHASAAGIDVRTLCFPWDGHLTAAGHRAAALALAELWRDDR